MKKLSLAFIFAFFSGASLYAQTPDWEWARTAGSLTNDFCQAIAIDTNGNIYTTGFGGGGLPFKFDTITINTPYFFISKYSSSGDIQWAKGTTGGFDYAEGSAITTDILNNIIVTGRGAPGNITFGGINLICNGLFMVKYRPNGTVVWSKNVASNLCYNAITSDVTSDKSGNIFVTGYFYNDTLIIGNDTLYNPPVGGGSNSDVFVAKYDSLGNALWAVSAQGNNNDNGNSISVDSLGNIYVTGFFSSSNVNFNGTNISSMGGDDIFIAKYNSTGIIQWVKRFGSSSSESGNSIKVDAAGNIYSCGAFWGPTTTFGNFTINNPGTQQEASYIVKLDSIGNVIWARSVADNGDVGLRENTICTDYACNLYVGGSFLDTVTIGNTTLIGKNGDIFVAKYDSSGNSLWVKTAKGVSLDYVGGVVVDRKNNLYVGGFYKSDTLTFRNAPLVNPYSNSEDMFLAKLADSALAKVYEIESENSISIFPNPANTSIAIKLNKNLQEVSSLKIMNMNGEIVAQHPLLKNNYDAQQIDISQLANGIYVYSLFSNNKQLGKPGKLVVLH